MRLTLLEPELITMCRSYIDDIGATVNHHDLFDDVQQACLTRRAFLFGSDDCFVVVHPNPERLLVWVGAAWTGSLPSSYVPDFEHLARDIEVPILETWSVRRGLARILPKQGFTAYANTWHGTPVTVWRKPLEY